MVNVEGLSLGFSVVGKLSKRKEGEISKITRRRGKHNGRKRLSASYKNQSFIRGYNVDKGCGYGKIKVKSMGTCFKCGVQGNRTSECSWNMNEGLC